MFILDSHEMKSVMFAKGMKTDFDIELWHKRIGHINLQKLKAIQLKVVVIRLPTCKEKDIESILKGNITSQTNFRLFSGKKEFIKSFRVDIWHNKMEWPNAKISTYCTGHVEREAQAKVVLGQSGQQSQQCYESAYDIGFARTYPARKVFRKEDESMTCSDIRLRCICAHPRQEETKARPELEKCILVGYSLKQKGNKCYNPST